MTTLITGANRGIGLELVSHYAAHGEPTIATTRSRPPEYASDKIEWQRLATDDAGSIRELAARLANRPVDLLVCNAGVYRDKGDRLEDGFGPEIWAETFAVNVTGVFLTIQALLPNLNRAAGAKIAIISSQLGSQERASGGSYIYRASKAAALNLGRNLAADLLERGIAVGIYHPGWVSTDMGGETAPVTPATSATGLAQRFSVLSLATTGCFECYDGTPIPF